MARGIGFDSATWRSGHVSSFMSEWLPRTRVSTIPEEIFTLLLLALQFCNCFLMSGDVK